MLLRQHFFVLEYLIDLDPKAAAIRAGYAPKHARKTAARLMRRPEIIEAIRVAMTERAARTGITAERIIEEYVRVAFVDLRLAGNSDSLADFLVRVCETPESAAAALAYIEGLAQRRPRSGAEEERSALASLARVLGLNLIEPDQRAQA